VSSAPTLARQLVRALAAARKRPLPASVALAAQLHLVDAIGVGLAAAASPIGAAYRDLAREMTNRGPATVFGQASGASAADAALINGGLIHSLEFDDTHTASIAHGSAVIAAAALAVAEARKASGAALLGAFARGWEVLIRFGLAAPTGYPARGFQNTSVAGPLAAALVSAELHDLSEDQSVAALGIALSQASGVFEFLTNGSSVKSLHPGWAAHGGVIAALLARGGMTGPETSLEGKHGLFRQFAGDDTAAQRFHGLLVDIGERWHLEDAAFKFYPCCHYLHPFIEAAGVLAGRGVRADDITHLLCRVPAAEAAIICEPWATKQMPETGHAGRWSLPIVVATRLIEGHVDLATFEHKPREAVLRLAARTQWEPLAGANFPQRFEAEIVCHTGSGAAQTIRIDDVFGNRTRPAGADAVMAKFSANAALALPQSGAQAVLESARALTAANDLANLSRAIRNVM